MAEQVIDDSAKKKALIDRRFECQNCGTCCSEMATIYPSREEVQKLAEYLNISELAFALRYLREIYDPQMNVYLLAFKSNHSVNIGNGCIFCHNKLCVIYNSSRTNLCNVFPWNHFDLETEQWEENFLSQDGKSWCPGVGVGRKWSLNEISDLKLNYSKVGKKAIRQYNVSSQLSVNLDVFANSNIFNLTISEENFIDRYRSLSMERRREFDNYMNSLYHL
jgi:Fe-S-cluster containining protein